MNGSPQLNIEGFTPLVSTVPTIQQMKQQNQAKRIEQELSQINATTDEEMNEAIRKNMPLSETIKTLRDSLKKWYPDASVLLLGTRQINDNYTGIAYEYVGEFDMIATALMESMHRNEHALKLFNKALLLFVNTSSKDEAEMAITALQDLIIDLQKRNSIPAQIQLKKSEIKRLRKCGRNDLAKIKEQEVEELGRRFLDDKKNEERKEALRIKRLECLARGRETMRLRREERKRKEQNRRNNPQPNFAKMAKQKRQQIAARQSEKKKKKSSSGGDGMTRSCSQLLSSK